jgi:hypothetical protein
VAWFVVRDAFGEVLEVTPCAAAAGEQARRMTRAIHAWQQRGDEVRKLDDLKYRMTSFDGNVRVLSIEEHRPSFRRDSALRPNHERATHERSSGEKTVLGFSSPLNFARRP